MECLTKRTRREVYDAQPGTRGSVQSLYREFRIEEKSRQAGHRDESGVDRN